VALLEKLKQELKALEDEFQRRENRILNGEVEPADCFLSTWANEIQRELVKTKIKILENGGVWPFEELFYIDGTPTGAKLVNTRFGATYRVEKPDGSIDWVNPFVRPETLEKKGYMLDYVERPAWACLKSSGTGLAGAMSCYVHIFPSRKNYATGEYVEE